LSVRSTAVTVLVALVLASALAAAPLFAAASVSGVVRYEGPAVQPLPLRMDADPKCAELHQGKPVLARDRLVAADGGLANVFVYLKAAPAGTGPFSAPQEPVQLEQRGCFYEPHVLGILVEQKLEVHKKSTTKTRRSTTSAAWPRRTVRSTSASPPRRRRAPSSSPASKRR
jgi:hypothetical protein